MEPHACLSRCLHLQRLRFCHKIHGRGTSPFNSFSFSPVLNPDHLNLCSHEPRQNKNKTSHNHKDLFSAPYSGWSFLSIQVCSPTAFLVLSVCDFSRPAWSRSSRFKPRLMIVERGRKNNEDERGRERGEEREPIKVERGSE